MNSKEYPYPANLLLDIGVTPDKSAIDHFDERLTQLLESNPVLLTERERKVVTLRYSEGKTFRDIGNDIGATDVYASALLRKALYKLRSKSDYLTDRVSVIRFVDSSKKINIETLDSIKAETATLKAAKAILDKALSDLRICLDDSSGSVKILTLDQIGLSIRSYHCLIRAGYKTVGDVMEAGPDAIMKCRNLGKTAYKEVRENLKALGFDVEKW